MTQQQQYRAIVLKDLIESEKAQVTELQGLVSNFLHPLEKSGMYDLSSVNSIRNYIYFCSITTDEFKQLTGNLPEVLDIHQQLLSLLEEEGSKASVDQRVGKLFLVWAPKVKNCHQTYCALHPKAVCILDKYKWVKQASFLHIIQLNTNVLAGTS